MLSFATPVKPSLFLLPLGSYSPSAAADGESWSRWIGWGIRKKAEEVWTDIWLVLWTGSGLRQKTRK